MSKELVGLLWSLKEDAGYAWRRAMEGDMEALEPLMRSMNAVRQHVNPNPVAVQTSRPTDVSGHAITGP